MTTQISTTNIQPAALAFIQGPVVSSIQITNSSYTVLDDTAVDTAGGYIKINGVNFVAGMNVVIGSVTATSVSVVSSTVLNVQVPAQSAGTYIVYVIAPDGGVSIVINGLTYSGTPTWVTGSTLTSGQVDEAISIQLDATGATSYALAAGSSLPAGLTLSSGGLLSGTVSGITVETLYNFTVNAIDNELQDSPRAFSITITASDQYFDYITTLLSANTPASTFVADASTNSFNVTVFGDTRPSNFGPYTPGYYSNYFDGSGDYLSTPYNSNLIPVSGTNFTAECWVYCTARTDFHNILSMNNSTTLDWRIMDNGGIWQTTLGGVTINGSSVVLNTWTHLAVVQSSNTVSFYINGVSQGSQAGSSWPNSGIQLTIGAWTQPGRYFTGYISNVRIVKGTAVYTSNFTPSTTPLTAVANTSLLTLQSPTFIDNSTNNFTITAVGDTAPRQFNPFGWTSASTAYTPAVYGGSGYFDGTGDFLNAPTANNAFAYGSGNFTVEAWIYPTKYTATIIDNRPAGSATGLFLGLVAGGNVQVYSNVQILISPGTVPLNTWTHIALSRSSNTMYLYINGVMVTSASNSTNFTDNNLRIGEQGGGGQPFGGYITDVRITKGIACYTNNFQPPVAPLTALTNTTLFTNMTGAGIYDSSMIAVSETVGDARINTSIVKFAGKSSISLDGTGDNLLMPTNPVFDFGTGNFTIEFWVYFNSLSSNRVLIERWSSGNAGGWQLYWRSTGTSMTFLVGASTVLLQDPNASRITTGQWYHIAVTRSGTTARMFIDGTQVVSASDSTSLSNSLPLSIGAQTSTSTNYFNGYMSDIRITRGVARYTANFTPATSPFVAR